MTKEDKIRQTLELQGSSEKFLEMVKVIVAPQLNEGQREEFIDVVKEYTPGYIDAVVEFMTEYYTEEEIDIHNEIMNNPKYKAVIEKSMKSMFKISPIIDGYFQNTLMKDERMTKIMDNM